VVSAAWRPPPVGGPHQGPQPVQPAAEVITDPTYVIGPDDVLSILFWRDRDTSADVMVRPDGKITLPLLNDIVAAGLTPEELRVVVQTAAEQYFEEPHVAVMVKQVNSRKVYITGMVSKPGPYMLTTRTTVLQLLAMAGGVADFAKKDRVLIMRTENGRTRSYKFNYKDVSQGKNLEQNIELKPGDTIIVP
jgi:polysaccharide biosynthesis/export protein